MLSQINPDAAYRRLAHLQAISTRIRLEDDYVCGATLQMSNGETVYVTLDQWPCWEAQISKGKQLIATEREIQFLEHCLVNQVPISPVDDRRQAGTRPMIQPDSYDRN